MVGMRAELVGLDDAIAADLAAMEAAELAGMREASDGLKEELRDQVEAAGLSRRLAYTWQNKLYPNKGESRGPAGLVYSTAPKIISLFINGGIVRPHAGSNYLWIPTDAVPLSTSGPRGSSRRGGKPKMTPDEVERHFNQEMFVRGIGKGHKGAFLSLVKGKSRKRGGFRQATKVRVRQGRTAELVLMFTLVRNLHFAKKLDPDGAARRWGDGLPNLIDKNWRD